MIIRLNYVNLLSYLICPNSYKFVDVPLGNHVLLHHSPITLEDSDIQTDYLYSYSYNDPLNHSRLLNRVASERYTFNHVLAN